MDVRDGDFRASARGSMAVELLARELADRGRTRRLLIGAACLFFALAALIVVFAPDGREGLATIMGAALVVMSLGAIGVSRFRFKAPGVEVATGLEQTAPTPQDRVYSADDEAGDNIPA